MSLNFVAYGCHNHNQKENKPGFFMFPNNDPELRQKWINACKREKRIVNYGIHQEKCMYLWRSLCDRYVCTSEAVEFS